MTARHRVALALLSLYTLIFAALSLDLLVRVVEWRGRFGSTLNLIVLLYFESMHTVVTIAGVALALFAARRAREFPAMTYLALALLLATIAYTKAIAFKIFGGSLQEAVADWLVAAGTPRWLMLVVFAHPEWAVWPAMAGALLFAARYPRPLTVDDIRESASRDRTGALRDVPLAGTDIGSVARAVATALLQRGWLSRSGLVWLIGMGAGALHTVLLRSTDGGARLGVQVGAALVAGAAAAVVIALVRAGMVACEPSERPLLSWLRRGALLTLILLTISAVAALVFPGGVLTLVSLSLAPLVFMVCAAAGCASIRRRLEPVVAPA